MAQKYLSQFSIKAITEEPQHIKKLVLASHHVDEHLSAGTVGGAYFGNIEYGDPRVVAVQWLSTWE